MNTLTCSPLSFVCLLLSLFTTAKTATATSTQTTTTTDEPPQPQQCGLWMAPSTIPGGNLGMYAGQDILPNQIIQQEMAIPFLFRDWEGPIYYRPHLHDDQDGALWFRYIWSGFVADLEQLDVTNVQNTKVVFVPGIGCTINSILDMRNIESTTGSTYDTHSASSTLPRRDPSAGAFTPYHASITKSLTRVIPAGSELFADYGDEWIPEIPGAQLTIDNLMDAAEDFLRDDYYPFIKQHETQLSERLKEGLWEFTRDFPHSNPKVFTVLPQQQQQQNWDWNTIQQKLEEFMFMEQETEKQKQHLQSLPPYYTEESSVIRYFIRQQGRRSLEWLQQHGYCSDHMRPGNSTIPHAGRGAFATRHLPKGTIVGYSPLVHVGIHGNDLYTVPYHHQQQQHRDYSKFDLIYNYAYGHPNSTVLLSPYGNMVNYINHASASPSASSNSNKRPNVRLQWPQQELEAHKPEWLHQSPEFLANTLEKVGLSLEYVALTDIQEGEEIFMDYGTEWEQAWNQHVKTWVPPEDADQYVHSSQWNRNNDKLRTLEELKDNPYPINLHTICLPSYHYVPQLDNYYYVIPDRDYVDRVVCHVMERFEFNSSTDQHEQQQQQEDLYTVDMILPGKQQDDPPVAKRVLSVPRSAVWITDKIMSQDWHLPNTFRHPIMIPDDIFPDAWKNRLTQATNNLNDPAPPTALNNEFHGSTTTSSSKSSDEL